MPRRPSATDERAARWEAKRLSLIDAADAAMAATDDPVRVAELAMALVDQVKPSPPTGGGLALPGQARPYAEAAIAALTRHPKEPRMTEPDNAPQPAPVTLPSLAEQNAQAIASVEQRIRSLVDERLRINTEVVQLRGALVALQAANRHYVKLGAQLALPLGGSTSANATGLDGDETGNGDAVMDDTDAALSYFGASTEAAEHEDSVAR